MLEIRQGIFLSTALTMSLFCGAARASEAPIVNEKPASATDKAAVDIEVQHSSAPVPGNAPIQLFTPLASKIIGPGIPDDSLNTQFPPESDEAIKRANELHAQAVEQLKKDDFVQAIKLDGSTLLAAACGSRLSLLQLQMRRSCARTGYHGSQMPTHRDG
jgi:hypothetical protein